MVKVQSNEGEFIVRPSTGGLIGDKHEPEIFAWAVHESVDPSHKEVSTWEDGSLLYAEHPVTGDDIDLSLSKYADDMGKDMVCRGSSS